MSLSTVLQLDVQIDKAIRFLADYLPLSDENSRKPILPHNVRVGMYLRVYARERGYSDEVVLAGFLHDVIEWSGANEELLRNAFGDEITRLVKASTKDDSITDKVEKTQELICRCVSEGRDALIVKTADILDSYRFYTEMQNQGELDYCKRNADAILEHKPANWEDLIFEDLYTWSVHK